MNDEHWTLKRIRICDIFSQRPSFIFLLLGGFFCQLSNGGEKNCDILLTVTPAIIPIFHIFGIWGILFSLSKDQWFRGNSIVMTLYSQEPAFKLFIYMLATLYKGVDTPLQYCIMALFCSINVIAEHLGEELLLSLFSKRINKQSNRIVAFCSEEPPPPGAFSRQSKPGLPRRKRIRYFQQIRTTFS